MNVQDFKSPLFIRNSKFNLTIESPKTSERRIKIVWTVRGSNDNNLSASFDTVHKRQHHRNNATLQLAVRLIARGCDGINFINENNSRSVLFCLLEGTAQVGFTVTSHFRHDFGTINEKEECSSFVCNSFCNESLPGSRRSMKQNPFRWFNTEGLKEGWVAQRQFNHFTNCGQLLTDASDVFVPNFEPLLMIFSFDWVSIAMNHSFWSDDAVFAIVRRVNLHDFELNRAKTLANKEGIPLPDWSVSLKKIGFQICFENVP
mmetsp:Transcript_22971/g.55717  ORF Transcript_22971/g.55717 Transcript_22971/m.55717 type:complete len:260 (+) Transcript_22971:1862-2641(+)